MPCSLAIHRGATLLLIAPCAIRSLVGSAANDLDCPTTMRQPIKKMISAPLLVSSLLSVASRLMPDYDFQPCTVTSTSCLRGHARPSRRIGHRAVSCLLRL